MRITILIAILTFAAANQRFLDRDKLMQHHNHNPDDEIHSKTFDPNQMIQVHIVPHSHDDVGWLKTVDEYYYGEQNRVQWAGVQYIIDSYIFSLLNDPNKKFIQVETAFFKMWWDEQNDFMKDLVKGLVKNGQLEFINGGWCMNDEATTYYEDIIDQMTLGHKFIWENFGVRPTIGWQIDPFGHQSSQAAIFSQMGFNAWFFARIDYQDKENRLQNQAMEMIMRPFQASGEDNSILAHTMYYHYSAPPGFDFNGRQFSDPVVDNENSRQYNIKERADQYVNYFRNMSMHYRGNILMHTQGEDFQWDAASIYYKNLDKLLNYINERKEEYNMEILYSTPSKYIEAINAQGETYPTKNDDFFPYADSENAFWTGYFTSRVAIKGLTRQAGRYTQVIHRLMSEFLVNRKCIYVNQYRDQILKDLNSLDEAMGILQHHDAVAGTEKQHVNNDYIATLVRSMDEIHTHIDGILIEFAEEAYGENSTHHTCNWNVTSSDCNITFNSLKEGKTVVITVLEGKINQEGETDKIRVKVPNVHLKVLDFNNETVKGEVFCSSEDDCDLYFLYTIDSVKFQYFRLVPTQQQYATVKPLQTVRETQLTNGPDGVQIQLGEAPSFKLRYGYYRSYQGRGQKSGAYIFRPEGATNKTLPYGRVTDISIHHGEILTIVVVKTNHTETQVRYFESIEWMKQVYEIETFIGPIPIDDKHGKEVVLLIDTGLMNNRTFYTDSNGLELQKRLINYRPTWDLNQTESASGNYYPVNGMILIQDQETDDAVALMNDRSQGGTSLRPGQLEIMIHRRTLRDDSRGVDEPLNETENDLGLTQKVQHRLVFFNRREQPNLHRKLQLYIDHPPYTFLSVSEKETFTKKETSLQATTEVEQLLHSIIENKADFRGALLKSYLQPWQGNTYLLRLQNFQEEGDFPFFIRGVDYIETILTGTQSWEDWQEQRLKWKIDGSEVTCPAQPVLREEFVLKPLQIRTFLITFKESVQE